jgi:hypothetical protein
MKTKMGHNYANLFVGFVGKQIFEQYTDPIHHEWPRMTTNDYEWPRVTNEWFLCLKVIK